MKKSFALFLSVSLSLITAVGMSSAFAWSVTKNQYDVVAGSSFELETDVGESQLRYRVINSSVVSCTNGDATIRTVANFPAGWTDIADIDVSYADPSGGSEIFMGRVRVYTRNPLYNPNYNYNYNYNYNNNNNNNNWYNPGYNPSYPGYPSDYPYNPAFYNNYYPNNYPSISSSTTVRESREPVVAVGAGRDRSSIANEIKNSASLTIDGVVSSFDMFITDSQFAINPSSTAKGMVKIKLNAGQLKRMEQYDIDGLRLNSTNANATLIVDSKMDTATNFNTFSIDAAGEDTRDKLASGMKLIGVPVEIEANSKVKGMSLEFHIGVKDELFKSQLVLLDGNGKEIDLTDAKLFRNKAEDSNGKTVYGYRLLVKDLPSGCYALAYK